MTMPVVESGGARIPAIGLGTWRLAGAEGQEAIETALACGYRALDTAARYENEVEVGAALRASGAKDVFVTTKVWHDKLTRDDFLASTEASLGRLKLDCVDLLLVHWPNPSVPLSETIGALCEAKARGLTKHVGVANFPVALLDEAVRLSSEPIVANQCEYHPWLAQGKLLAACRRLGVAFTSYSPLGRGELMADPAIGRIAALHGRTPAQIVLRWHLQQGVVAIPRSGSAKHIAQNLDVLGFELSDKDMATLSALARSDGRLVAPDWSPDWDTA